MNFESICELEGMALCRSFGFVASESTILQLGLSRSAMYSITFSLPHPGEPNPSNLHQPTDTTLKKRARQKPCFISKIKHERLLHTL